MKRRNRSAWHTVLSSPITLIVVIVLAGFLARAVWSINQKATTAADKLDQANADLAKLESNKADLEARVGSLSTDAGVKAAIREKYHAVEPGEQVAVIVDDSVHTGSGGSSMASSSTAGTATSQPMAQGTSWWSKMLRMMGL